VLEKSASLLTKSLQYQRFTGMKNSVEGPTLGDSAEEFFMSCNNTNRNLEKIEKIQHRNFSVEFRRITRESGIHVSSIDFLYPTTIYPKFMLMYIFLPSNFFILRSFCV
jgi:hypothetical protein